MNGRNPFKKDDHLIDYDKDSEEEFLEENAEDIKSNENSDEEENNEEEDEEGAAKWIVPDGHLSEDEVSENEDLNLKNFSNNKFKSIMEILDVRKNYTKPILISFNLNDMKYKGLNLLLKARIFNTDQSHEKENLIKSLQFPIQIVSTKLDDILKKDSMNILIKDRLDEIVREIHFSYLTKDLIIKEIKIKFPKISKNALEKFFKDCVLKDKCNKTQRVNKYIYLNN